MAVAEGSFKVCGLCSQLVDEGVKLPDNLLEFLVTFLVVPGTKLPTKICTECYQGALESKKFKEKCLKTIDKLTKTQISTNMILGRSAEDIKTMKNKYKASPVKEIVHSSPEVKFVPSKQRERGRRASIGDQINSSIENTFTTPTRRTGRSSSDHSGSGAGYEDLPLSTRQSLRKKAIQQAAGTESKKYPQVVLSPNDRKAAENALGKNSSVGKLRGSKRKIRSPAKFDPMPVSRKKARVEQPAPAPVPPKTEPKHEPDPEPEVIDLDDDEEIFPSVGPYQCEICQQITDTKQEFVAHVKSLHKDMVDEHVLRSLETDLKKRMKKELEQKKNATKQKSQAVKSQAAKSQASKSQAAKSHAIPAATPAPDTPPGLKQSRSSKPKPRPRPKYAVDEDDDYRPDGKKRRSKSQITPVKNNVTKSIPKDKLYESGTCDICGTVLSRAKDLPKHQESLKCRQAAFRKSNQMPQAQSDPLSQVEAIKPVSDPAKESPILQPPSTKDPLSSTDPLSSKDPLSSTESPSTTEPAATEPTPVPGAANIETSEQSETNVTEGESSNTKVNGLDAKFKANIAKRYEAERGSGEEKVTDDVMGSAVWNEMEDTEMAIKKAMKESLETAKKELAVDPLGASPKHLSRSSNEKTGAETSQQQPTEQGDNGEHSPAAYIDPTPQPDVEPQKTSVIHSVPKNTSMSSEAMEMHKDFDKPWMEESGRPKDVVSSTLDLSSLDSSSVPPTSSSSTINPFEDSLDTLESQMAALHGATGANNAWHSFQPTYYNHQRP